VDRNERMNDENLWFHGFVMRSLLITHYSPNPRPLIPTSPLAGTATPALSGCPRQQGRWVGGAFRFPAPPWYTRSAIRMAFWNNTPEQR
jgi:hypothetical protein